LLRKNRSKSSRADLPKGLRTGLSTSSLSTAPLRAIPRNCWANWLRAGVLSASTRRSARPGRFFSRGSAASRAGASYLMQRQPSLRIFGKRRVLHFRRQKCRIIATLANFDARGALSRRETGSRDGQRLILNLSRLAGLSVGAAVRRLLQSGANWACASQPKIGRARQGGQKWGVDVFLE
jgi:hypothetical protein